MAYTVLARRYRSANFDELLGQEHIAKTLKRAIESNRIAHAFLFCGTRGTGKTSAARILAKALNCESSDKATPNPCSKCISCQAIARGEDMDTIEIDAASNTGVDNVRDVIANSQFRPARSRYKVYIIDEVHMLSKQAFNALLKTLEEPPEHVKFILATTEPEKVLATILSRCQRYDFRNIPTRQIAGHLKDICTKEKIKADDDALLLVAKAGAGSMRDALSLLDRLLSFGEKDLSVDLIEEMLGLARVTLILDLAHQIGQGDVKATLLAAEAMVGKGLSIDTLVAQLSDHFRNLLILCTIGNTDLVEVPGLSAREMSEQAGKFDAVTLSQNIVILEELRRQLRTSTAGRALLDAILVRLTLAKQSSSISELLGSTQDSSQKKKIDLNSSGESFQRDPQPAVQTSPTPSTNDDDDDDLPRPGKVWSNDGPSLSELLKNQQNLATSTPSATPKVLPEDTSNVAPPRSLESPETWAALLNLLATRSRSVHGMLTHARLDRIEHDQATVKFSEHHRSFARALEMNGKREILATALSEVMGRQVGVRIEFDSEQESSPEIIANELETRPAGPASATTAPTISTQRRADASAPVRAARPPEQPAPRGHPPAALRPGGPPTPEQVQALLQDPLIAAIVQQLDGEIKWVE